MGANSWVKRGKRDIAAGVVERLRERVVDAGLVMRLSCCGARRMVVRSDCMKVLLILVLGKCFGKKMDVLIYLKDEVLE